MRPVQEEAGADLPGHVLQSEAYVAEAVLQLLGELTE